MLSPQPQMALDAFADNPVVWVTPAPPRETPGPGNDPRLAKLRAEAELDPRGFGPKHGLSEDEVEQVRTGGPIPPRLLNP